MAKVKRAPIYIILLITALGAYVLNIVHEGVELAASAKAKKENLRKRQLMEERILAITKETWPECVNNKLTAEECKEFIDNEIYTMDHHTDQDKYVRSIIIGKRFKSDREYNSVVITMNDDDMVFGRDGDGLIYYDFTWDGSGEQATEDQETALPPICAMEPTASLPLGAEPVPAPTEEGPLIILDKEIEGVRGCTINEFIQGTNTAPLAGGVLCDGTAMNTPEGDAKIQAELEKGVTVESAGERYLEPIDCTGLTGESCCLLVKLKVRDHDLNGNAIQCSLDYISESAKKQHWLNHRGKKIHIFANHNNRVSKVPKVVGDWPQGITGEDFEEWLREAGALPKIMLQG